MDYYQKFSSDNQNVIELLEKIRTDGIRVIDNFWESLIIQGAGAFFGAVPLAHEKIDQWRDALNFIITGGIDDIWVDSKGEHFIVDCKSTSKVGEVTLDDEWKISYKRQIEIYQWLFRQNGFKVSKIGYFVYCNGDTDKEAFDAKLEFNIKIIPYEGNDSWVEKTILKAYECLQSNLPPISSKDCDFCKYNEAVFKYKKMKHFDLSP